VEVTSESPDFPIESVFGFGNGLGWRAAEPGQQLIRIVFDEPRSVHRIQLRFSEQEVERPQEFTLRWSGSPGDDFREIVRQQWNFSPQGSTSEIEDYRVSLPGVSTLELTITPDLRSKNANGQLVPVASSLICLDSSVCFPCNRFACLEGRSRARLSRTIIGEK
jgi:hypothetical protein